MGLVIINATPHTVTDVESSISYPPRKESCIRVSETLIELPRIHDSHRLYKRVFGDVENVPLYRTDTFYIVSAIVKDRLPDRTDFWSPGVVVRGDDGNIIGCKGFIV